MPDNRGFDYIDDNDRIAEFERAEAFLNLFFCNTNEQVIKLPRRIGAHFTPPLKHSYVKQGDELIAFSRGKKGGAIGEGAFGHVKYVKTQSGEDRVVKIETTNTSRQQQESHIAQDQALQIGNKIIRDDHLKFYSILHYLGPSLKTELQKHHFSLKEKIHTAGTLCWEIYLLHTGQLSSSKKKYAHGDLKPENIARNGSGIKLMDFGLSTHLSNPPTMAIHGSPLYLPIEHSVRSKIRIDKNIRQQLLQRMCKLGYLGLDIFALKRLLYLSAESSIGSLYGHCIFTPSEYDSLPSALQQLMDTTSIDKAIESIDQASSITLTLHFLALEYTLDVPRLNALSAHEKEQFCAFCASVNLTDQEENLDTVCDPGVFLTSSERVTQVYNLLETHKERISQHSFFNKQPHEEANQIKTALLHVPTINND